jgi:hypothetical protein
MLTTHVALLAVIALSRGQAQTDSTSVTPVTVTADFAADAWVDANQEIARKSSARSASRAGCVSGPGMAHGKSGNELVMASDRARPPGTPCSPDGLAAECDCADSVRNILRGRLLTASVSRHHLLRRYAGHTRAAPR